MNKLMFTLTILLCGCASNQKTLRMADDLLIQAKTADCDTIKTYLELIRQRIEEKLKK